MISRAISPVPSGTARTSGETPLEGAELPKSSFNLAVAASSFHWVDEDVRAGDALRALRPGGMGRSLVDGLRRRRPARPVSRRDDRLMSDMPRSPVGSRPRRPDSDGGRRARRWLSALAASGFVDVAHERIPWSKTFDARASASSSRRSRRSCVVDEERRTTTFLDELERIARATSATESRQPIVTALYTARKPS